MTREQMFDMIIQKLGHEHKATIWFIGFAETVPAEKDEQLYRVLMALIDLVEYAMSLGEEE